jgi:phospholipid-binding lipoprotein MlaA
MKMGLYRFSLLLACVTLLSSCGHVAAYQGGNAENDPIEPINRKIFAFNMFLDRTALRPVAETYREVLPQPVRNSVRNVLSNLEEPFSAVNSLLQGKIQQTGNSVTRFAVNSTFGFLGAFDVAAREGVLAEKEDFGQTLAVWGVGEGAYLMLPFFGPSNLRDTTGRVVKATANPADLALQASDYAFVTYAATGVDAVATREELLDPLDELRRNSVDFYAAVRSLYRQRRARAIGGEVATDAKTASDEAFKDFEQE